MQNSAAHCTLVRCYLVEFYWSEVFAVFKVKCTSIAVQCSVQYEEVHIVGCNLVCSRIGGLQFCTPRADLLQKTGDNTLCTSVISVFFTNF